MVAAPPASSPPAIRIFVRGQPLTKGSLHVWHSWRANGSCVTGVSEQSGPALKEWRALIATAAKNAMRHELPFAGPVQVALTFYFPRPKSHTAAQRLIPYAYGNRKWDLDKLERAIYDALTDAAVWQDDSQVARNAGSEKRYVEGDEVPGVSITIEALT